MRTLRLRKVTAYQTWDRAPKLTLLSLTFRRRGCYWMFSSLQRIILSTYGNTLSHLALFPLNLTKTLQCKEHVLQTVHYKETKVGQKVFIRTNRGQQQINQPVKRPPTDSLYVPSGTCRPCRLCRRYLQGWRVPVLYRHFTKDKSHHGEGD